MSLNLWTIIEILNSRINYALKIALNKGIPPMNKDTIKTDPKYSELHQLLKESKVLS